MLERTLNTVPTSPRQGSSKVTIGERMDVGDRDVGHLLSSMEPDHPNGRPDEPLTRYRDPGCGDESMVVDVVGGLHSVVGDSSLGLFNGPLENNQSKAFAHSVSQDGESAHNIVNFRCERCSRADIECVVTPNALRNGIPRSACDACHSQKVACALPRLPKVTVDGEIREGVDPVAFWNIQKRFSELAETLGDVNGQRLARHITRMGWLNADLRGMGIVDE